MKNETNYMNEISGDVATESEWKNDFDSMDPQSWGYPENYSGEFSDWIKIGKLIEVEMINGEWVEV